MHQLNHDRPYLRQPGMLHKFILKDRNKGDKERKIKASSPIIRKVKVSHCLITVEAVEGRVQLYLAHS